MLMVSFWDMRAIMDLIFLPATPPFLAYTPIRFSASKSSLEKNWDCRWTAVIHLNSASSSFT
uniref:Uncharacterized protein n=1 Tax=Anguilla anguilla TaxID=7936 RepID=A0A0E9SK85_ANGAN